MIASRSWAGVSCAPAAELGGPAEVVPTGGGATALVEGHRETGCVGVLVAGSVVVVAGWPAAWPVPRPLFSRAATSTPPATSSTASVATTIARRRLRGWAGGPGGGTANAAGRVTGSGAGVGS